MGMFDTMNQGKQMSQGAPIGANSMGQGFAQKQQMQANPMMKGRPAMGAPMGAPNMSQTPNPMTGARPMMNTMAKSAGQMGSRPQVMQRQQLAKQQNPGLGPSIAPQDALRSKLQAQQGGLPTLGSNPIQAPTAMGQAQEQMRGYEGPDMGLQDPRVGLQDPRELARMGQSNQIPLTQLYGSTGGVGPSQEGMTNIFGSQPLQEMQQMNQPVQMDENGLEPRRGAR